jgi:hypothetical protein
VRLVLPNDVPCKTIGPGSPNEGWLDSKFLVWEAIVSSSVLWQANWQKVGPRLSVFGRALIGQ